MQLECIVRKRFVDESGIRERYERYIAKAVIDGTINYTPISFDAIHSVCALPEPSKYTALFNLLYTLNEETRGYIKQEWDNIRWNNYYPRCHRCFCPAWALLQLHNTSNDYSVYKAIVAQTRVIAYPNKRSGSA